DQAGGLEDGGVERDRTAQQPARYDVGQEGLSGRRVDRQDGPAQQRERVEVQGADNARGGQHREQASQRGISGLGEQEDAATRIAIGQLAAVDAEQQRRQE